MSKTAATFLAGASAIALLMSAGSAAANVVLTTGQFGGLGVHSDPGLTASIVTGHAGADIVTLSTIGDQLHTTGGGESDYNAADGVMDDLTVAFTGFYDAVTFNISPPNGQTSSMHLVVNGGAFTFDVPNLTIPDPLGNGENKFVLTATGLDAIHTIAFTYDPGVAHIQQIRVGNLVGGVVPEPSTWAMLITGFGMVGAGLRMRRPRGVKARVRV